jgi:acetolactate decarboxylase
MKIFYIFCFGLLAFHAGTVSAQSSFNNSHIQFTIAEKNKINLMNGPTSLFQYGIADAFVNGLYEGELSIKELKQQGNFGIGAPNFIDGELTMINGKVYQTNAKGKTFEALDTLKSPLVFVTSFKAETMFSIPEIADVHTLFTQLEKLLPNRNNIYAIRISGDFSKIKTRAFSPVVKKPFKPLAQLLDQQHVFNFEHTNGSMIGFYIPGYLAGINIVGLHFHYLSSDLKQGGHVLDVRSEHVMVEISEIDEFHLNVPATTDYKIYDFKKDNSPALNVVEKGAN